MELPVHVFGDDDYRQPGLDASGGRGGLYPGPRPSAGSTAVKYLVLMSPPDADWDAIAELAGDPSWRATAMRRYFQRIENCRYRPVARLIALHPGDHQYDDTNSPAGST